VLQTPEDNEQGITTRDFCVWLVKNMHMLCGLSLQLDYYVHFTLG